MMRVASLVLAGIACASLATGAAARSLEEIQSMRGGEAPTAAAEISGVRLAAIRETGLIFGMQSALQAETEEVNRELERQKAQLDVTFAFDRVLVDRMLLPPVLSQQTGVLRINDDVTARSVGESYRIEYPARIVGQTPTWRDFLVRTFPNPKEPSPLALPRNGEEEAVWRAAAAEGWARGKMQARAAFTNNLALLTRVYRGMVTYTVLSKQGVVSVPRLSSAQMGVTYDATGREMNVGDTIYRVAESGEFQRANRWTFVAPNLGSADGR